ncbi:MAG TPA: hypothetical protein RMH99_14620 [Sandaracinaceae bacterium LLY-WYZ-13_1]|nr:hypothetical protein [Sandaracinaceae bacterium LLY-WYZ-13_1]
MTRHATPRSRALGASLRAALSLAAAVLLGVGASPAAASEPSVTVQVRAPEAVDPEALREALEQDLGVRVEIVRPDAEGEARVLVELDPDGTLRLRVRRDGRPALTRETRPGADRARTTVTVSLLVANLVRDESGDVLALLEPTPEPPAPAPEPPVVVVGPPPLAEAPDAPEPTEPEPPSDRAAPPPRIFAGIDFAPGVGVSTAFGGRERRTLSLGVLGALTGGLDGVGLSSTLDLSLGDVNGVQVAGAWAHGHEVLGGQLAGVAAVAEGRMRGVQVGGAAAIAGPVAGGQLSGVAAVAAGPVHGLQVGGALSLAAGEARGVQLSGLTAVAAGPMRGLQLAPVNVAGDALRGAQLGVLNVAGDTEGAQLGVTNVGGRVRGLQLGLFNVAEEADAAVGLFSVHTRGHSHLRAEVDTNGFLGASFVHRGPVTYSLVSASVEPFLSRPMVALGLGLGARAQLVDVLHLDVEANSHVLLHDRVGQRGPDAMFDLRLLLGWEILDGVALYGGVGFRTHLSDGPEPEMGAPILAFDTGAASSGLRARGWPALYGGVELF